MKHILEGMMGRRVAVVGDVMRDHYVWCHAAAGRLRAASFSSAPGGAANVAENVDSLGGVAALLGVVGDDPDGVALQGRFGNLTWAYDRPTTAKTRVMSGPECACRYDHEVAAPVDDNARRELLWRVGLAPADAYVISDYGKGVVGGAIARAVLSVAAARGKPVVVDTKSSDWSIFEGAAAVKVNEAEFLAWRRREADFGGPVVVTTGDRGCRVWHDGSCRRESTDFLALPCEGPADPTGAGDTFAAALALALGAGAGVLAAAQLANVAAGLAARKPGTAAVTADELRAQLETMG